MNKRQTSPASPAAGHAVVCRAAPAEPDASRLAKLVLPVDFGPDRTGTLTAQASHVLVDGLTCSAHLAVDLVPAAAAGQPIADIRSHDPASANNIRTMHPLGQVHA